jgi:hypothetical protein
MSSDKVGQIDARFGGEQVAFRLEPGAHWAEIHDVWLGPLLALHQRILASISSRAEVERVLSLAYVGAKDRALASVPEVVDVLDRSPIGTYIPLAARILEAHIFGVEADLARWDEREAFR